jgi:putative DNA primase/helicase
MKPASPPAWLLSLVRKSIPAKPSRPTAYPLKSKRAMAYAKAALDHEQQRLASAPLHQRNNTLNRCAFRLGQLVAGGYLVESDVAARLKRTAAEIGLEPAEIDATVQSGVGAGKRSPRGILTDAGQRTPAPGPGSNDAPLTAALAQLGCTDADNAERFVKRHGAPFAYCPERGWLHFDGKRWRSDTKKQRILAAIGTARQIAAEVSYLTDKREQEQHSAHVKRSQSKVMLDRMLDLAAPMMMVAVVKLDADPWLFNVSNGTLDMRAGRLYPHDARDMITKLASVEYDPKAEALMFRHFMRRVLNGSAELYQYVQCAVGYSLTGITSEQVFFYVRGEQKNGKSTFVNMIRDMMGDYAIHTPTETLMVKAYDNTFPMIWPGRRALGWSPRLKPLPGQLDEAKIKAMTGGDQISARFMRAEWFTFTPEFKLWFVANDDPRVRSTDAALWRRIRVIPFDVIIPDEERDPKLPEKLRAELPGILAWAVRGCLRWQRDGLKTPDVVDAATSSYRKRADHLRRFLRECVIQEEHAETASSPVYQAYTDWCALNHERPLSTAQFKRQLEDLGYEHARVKSGSVWRRIRLRR